MLPSRPWPTSTGTASSPARVRVRAGRGRLVEAFAHTLSSGATTTLRYAIVTAIGAVLLYLGLKAVQLTGISSRVSKRSTEYGLVLEERRRLTVRGPAATS